MNRPDARTMVLGHPWIAGPVELGGILALIACWQAGGDGVLPAIPIGLTMAATAKASERALAYKRWKREWDAMAGPDGAPRKWKPGTLPGFALGAVLIVGVLLLAGSGKPTQQLALGMAILAAVATLIVLALRGIVRWLSRRRGNAPVKPATVVAKRLLPGPSLPDAYAALPEHCQRILTRPAP